MKKSISKKWLKGGTSRVTKSTTKCHDTNPTEWLDIIWKGRMVEINGLGQIRDKYEKKSKRS